MTICYYNHLTSGHLQILELYNPYVHALFSHFSCLFSFFSLSCQSFIAQKCTISTSFVVIRRNPSSIESTSNIISCHINYTQFKFNHYLPLHQIEVQTFWSFKPDTYRVKPDTLSDQLPHELIGSLIWQLAVFSYSPL